MNSTLAPQCAMEDVMNSYPFNSFAQRQYRDVFRIYNTGEGSGGGAGPAQLVCSGGCPSRVQQTALVCRWKACSQRRLSTRMDANLTLVRHVGAHRAQNVTRVGDD